MTATQRYIEALKQRHDLPSNYRVAKVLEVSRAAVGLQVNGKVGMGDDQAIKVAELLDLDPLEVLAELYAERAPTERASSYWKGIAEKARRSAAALGAVILSGVILAGGGIETARASAGYMADRDLDRGVTSYTLCAVLRRAIRRFLESIGAFTDGLAEAA